MEHFAEMGLHVQEFVVQMLKRMFTSPMKTKALTNAQRFLDMKRPAAIQLKKIVMKECTCMSNQSQYASFILNNFPCHNVYKRFLL